MRCPSCKEDRNLVIDSRVTENGSAIRRRRRCEVCDRRFTTKERLEEEVRLTVVKSNGQRVPYSRDKIRAGVHRACYKLNVTEQQIDELVDGVEEDLFRLHDREATSQRIGVYVTERLRKLNTVAYVRFMSVYRKYSSIDEFIVEITEVRDFIERESPEQQSLFED